MDLFFALTGISDGIQQAIFVATLLIKSAYTWYVAQGFNVHTMDWRHLK